MWVWSRVGQKFSCSDVKRLGAVVRDRIFYRLFHPLPFVCEHVDDDRPIGIFEGFEGVDEFFYVMAVDGADVGDAVLFEEGSGTDEVFQRLGDLMSLFCQHGAVAGDL